MARCDASFRDTVVDRCLAALVSAGFKRLRKNSVYWPIRDGFYCWVGLNQGLYSNYLYIEPFVGVHVEPIARLYSKLDKGKYAIKYDRGVATYSVHLGELSGASDEPKFLFEPQHSEKFINDEAGRLAQLYIKFGLPFAESIASYEALLPMLQERLPMLNGYPQRVASCLYLMGRIDAAREFVEGFLSENREVFEGFAIPFLAMVRSERI
ncbi:hypothetical protein [Novosphingobium aerophilum]|uniref:DUF4304 domain-containing protein n=1 Tax=Novosphingobium aerophilum TaxID=2839843 RepID=A0A7X1FA44_9SPHN|nr:hypothetical protein [Novosphingobium aerophilum]MBC2653213.1 hypothetical protein [Novosphingobium aerophilum]